MVSSMMAGLRGSNMNDDNFAADDVQMQLVEIHDENGDAGSLPLTYDPKLIDIYWGNRPVAVVTRVFQLFGETCLSYTSSPYSFFFLYLGGTTSKVVCCLDRIVHGSHRAFLASALTCDVLNLK